MSTFVKIPDQWVQKGMDIHTCYILSKMLEFQKRGQSYHMSNKKFIELYPWMHEKTLSRRIKDLKITYIVIEERRHGNNVAKLKVDESELECFINGSMEWKNYLKKAIEIGNTMDRKSKDTMDNVSKTMDNVSNTMDFVSNTTDRKSEPIYKNIKENKNINTRKSDVKHPPSGNDVFYSSSSSSSLPLTDEMELELFLKDLDL
jgi:hypothetical protein